MKLPCVKAKKNSSQFTGWGKKKKHRGKSLKLQPHKAFSFIFKIFFFDEIFS